MEETTETHESFGMLSISKFTANNIQFYGSDLFHNGGISIDINGAETVDKHCRNSYFARNSHIRIRLSYNQFVDAITGAMNTQGVPCTIDSIAGKSIERIDYVKDKKNVFKNGMKEVHQDYHKRIDEILEILTEGNIGKRKKDEIIHELKVLKSHIHSNTEYVMKTFNEAMDDTITEAKQNISGYIDNKVHSLGIEHLRKELPSIDKM